jgi:hypothetical protein
MLIRRIVIPAALFCCGVVLLYYISYFIDFLSPHEVFDRSTYDKITAGMSIEDVEQVLCCSAGEYPPRPKPAVPEWRHGPALGHRVKACRWDDGQIGNQRTETKWWLGPLWGINVGFDESGRVISKSLWKLQQPDESITTGQ